MFVTSGMKSCSWLQSREWNAFQGKGFLPFFIFIFSFFYFFSWILFHNSLTHCSHCSQCVHTLNTVFWLCSNTVETELTFWPQKFKFSKTPGSLHLPGHQSQWSYSSLKSSHLLSLRAYQFVLRTHIDFKCPSTLRVITLSINHPYELAFL